MGNLILAIPDTRAGSIAREHIRSSVFVQRDLGCRYIEPMSRRLNLSGVNNFGNADRLPYDFHLLYTEDGDEIAAINRILSWHNDPNAITMDPMAPHGYIELAEPDTSLMLYATPPINIGTPFTFDSQSMHNTYLKKLQVDVAHSSKINVKGAGINVAIVDSGAAPTCGFVKGFRDIENTGNSTQTDNHGHGTGLAAIIHDVAPDAQIYVIRINDQAPTLWYTMAGICAAVFDFQAKIVNLSLGFKSLGSRCGSCGTNDTARSMVFEKLLWALTAVDAQRKLGITPPIYVTATGNQGNTSSFNYPAAYPDTLAVGSVTSNLKRSTFSNYGTTSHQHYLMLPGGDVDASGNPTEWVGSGSKAKCAGTSYAAAYASGILALYWSDPRYQQQNRVDILDTLSSRCNKNFSDYLDSQGKAKTTEYGSGFLYYH